MISLLVSRETLEALHQHVHCHCPCALEDREFLPGLIVLVEEEIVSVVQAERARAVEQARKPSES